VADIRVQERTQAPTAYDHVPYPGYAYPQTHPDRLATLARLFGVSAAPVDGCRVLELGCGDGGNLLPMAHGLPDSEFVGVDLASKAVARGHESADALGLTNIEFVCADLAGLGGDLGKFDFVIAHGLYSWVPDDVRDRLLGACREHLAPTGVAFVSYNALPGSHMRTMLREMMIFDGQARSAPANRTRRARQFLAALKDGCSADPAYRQILTETIDQALAKSDAALLHDDLSPDNRPVYFHQFIAHARAHRLQYLAEADYFEMHAGVSSPEAISLLDEHADDILVREQYLDFLKCRRFRQTLLCHDAVAINRNLSPALANSFRIASHAEPADGDEQPVVVFRGPHQTALRTDEPVIKAALGVLRARWPATVRFGELLALARAELTASEQGARSEADDTRVLGEALLRAYAVNLVELHVHQPPFITTPAKRPRASAVARRQAALGQAVTTLRHTTLRIDDATGRRLITLLDGTRDRAALERELAQGSDPPSDLAAKLDRKLTELARLALLET
jgi:SAM-dependent methyltransferase